MKVDLSGKTAIVTGGGSGIGKAIAQELARTGANVTICGRRREPLEKTLEEIKKLGSKGLAIQVDVTKKPEVEILVNQTVETFGGLEILVNNAGVIVRAAAEEILEEDWDYHFAINLKGAFLCSQAAFPYLAKKGGKIINMASVQGIIPIPGRAAYIASKAGLIGLTKDLAGEWAKYKINVNAIAPGWHITEMTSSFLAKKEVQDMLMERIPLKRFGTTQEVAYVAVFLASNYADYITGQTICVDAGWTSLK